MCVDLKLASGYFSIMVALTMIDICDSGDGQRLSDLYECEYLFSDKSQLVMVTVVDVGMWL